MAGKPYLTPLNERSFSGLVDRAILETGKIQAFLSAVQYANLAVRECQVLGLFSKDMIEDEITPTADPHIFTRPRNFRSFRSVKYSLQCVYPKLRLPGKIQRDKKHYFYAADDYYVFKGVLLAETIQTAAYYWQKPLIYYSRLGTITDAYQGGPYAVRKAFYDTEAEKWQYLNDAETAYVDEGTISGGDDEEALRRRNAMNWLVDEWWDLILEGVKAKLFKQFGDERAAISYSLYKSGQKNLQMTSGFEAEIPSLTAGDE